MIIKCPECGHQVSDKAPVCPSCGVEIAGHIIKCPHCGEIYFKSDGICPNCYHRLDEQPTGSKQPTPEETLNQQPNAQQPVNTVDATDERAETPSQPIEEQPEEELVIATPEEDVVTAEPLGNDEEVVTARPIGDKPKAKKPQKKNSTLLVSFLIAAIFCAVMLYLYYDGMRANEQRSYEQAMMSTNPTELQTYLNIYKDADQAHIDSVEHRLKMLAQKDSEWTDALTRNTKEAYKQYLDEHPNSPFRSQALAKIDALDWQAAVNGNSADAYAAYKMEHPNGAHAAEADEAIKKWVVTDVNDDERSKAFSAIRAMLQAMNGHNEGKLAATLNPSLSHFNDKQNAPATEVVAFMNHLYENVTRLNWHLDNANPKVSKQYNGKDGYNYEIEVPARLSQNLQNGSNAQNYFQIKALVDNNGTILSLNMTKTGAPAAAPAPAAQPAPTKAQATASKPKATASKPSTAKKPAASNASSTKKTTATTTKKPATSTTSNKKKTAAATPKKSATTASKTSTNKKK